MLALLADLISRDHGLDPEVVLLLDLWPDQGGHAGWMIAPGPHGISFTVELRPAPWIDDELGRLTAWEDGELPASDLVEWASPNPDLMSQLGSAWP